MDNTVTVVGNITRDPELRFTTGGRAVTQFGVAVNRRFQVNNEWREQTSFFDVIAWGELGENVAASLPKGARIVVTGRLEQRSWSVDADGKAVDADAAGAQRRSKVEIIADDVAPSLRWATCEVVKRERSSTPMPEHPADIGSDEEPF